MGLHIRHVGHDVLDEDYGDAAYIILEGDADILVDSPKGAIKVTSLGKNDIIGEIAILCDVPRTATVVAHSDLETLLGADPSGAMRWIAFGQTKCLDSRAISLVAGPVSRRGAHYAASWTGTHARMTRRLIAQA
jgi:hypothetical protein